MAEPMPKPEEKPATQAGARPAPKDREYGHMPLSEEMDNPKWTLPPVRIVLIGIGIVAVVGLIFGWFFRYEPVASGQVGEVFAVSTTDGSSVLATVQVTVKNTFEKAIYIRNLKGELKTADGKAYEDTPASEVDYERYFQAFPELRQHAGAALKPEAKIEPGQQAQGTLVFGFNVPKDQFYGRQNLLITVEPYDRRAIVIAEKPQK